MVERLIESLEAKGHRVEVCGEDRNARIYIDDVFYGIIMGNKIFRI